MSHDTEVGDTGNSGERGSSDAPTVESYGSEREAASRERARLLAYAAVVAAIRKAIASSSPTEEEVSRRLGRRKDYITRVLADPADLTLPNLGAILWACGMEVNDFATAPLGESDMTGVVCNFCRTPRTKGSTPLVSGGEGPAKCYICRPCAALVLEIFAEDEASTRDPVSPHAGAQDSPRDASADNHPATKAGPPSSLLPENQPE